MKQSNFAPRSPLISVHLLKIKCPICGHRDNCALSEDRTRAYCRRVRSEHPGRDGGWTHILIERDFKAGPVLVSSVTPTPTPPRVDRAFRDVVYRTLLRCLPLLPAHRDDLLRRRLSLQSIEQGNFKSTPTEDERRMIERNLYPADLAGIAGFYREGDVWRMVKTPSGFFIPVLDRDGLIQGLQIRKDYQRDKDDPRYVWLSSKRWPSGTSSGAPVHIQNPERIAATGRAIITEGSLKSFVAATYLSPNDGGLIALAGVSSFKEHFGSLLRQVWPELHTISIAFDADWKEKREVKAQLHRLIKSLKAASIKSITVRTWEREKGLDDFLVAESYEVAEVA